MEGTEKKKTSKKTVPPDTSLRVNYLKARDKPLKDKTYARVQAFLWMDERSTVSALVIQSVLAQVSRDAHTVAADTRYHNIRARIR